MKLNNKALIILNLGSPDSYEVKDVRKYLNEFLMDEKVIDISSVLRQVIVKGFIVPFRAPKSAKAYQSVWTERGSPLKVITEDFANQVQDNLEMPVTIAMRYGNPTPAESLKDLESRTKNLEEILIAPMYPHYAMSSYETAVEYITNHIHSLRKDIQLRILKPFYNEPGYISSLAESIKPYLSQNNFDAYLFSYHGLPIRHLKKSDTTNNHCYSSNNCCKIKSLAWDTCYKHQVKTTTKLVAERLNLDSKKVIVSFQSRIGSDKWIQPFTDKELEELPKRGVKKLLVVCPAFVADCLETLEEIDDRGKETFMHNGGETFVRVPCLNTSSNWVTTFTAYSKGYETDYKNWWN
ncbi:MAG: ferrochelatase [Saprospiraceae bacterium]